MKRIFFLALAIPALNQLCQAAACSSDTLANYISLGSCTVGAHTLSGFQVLEGTAGAIEVAATDILLSPVFNTTKPGLNTTLTAASSANEVREAIFAYEISGLQYTGSAIALSDASETGDGAVTGIQTFCAGGIFPNGNIDACTGMPGTLATLDGVQNGDSTVFGAVGFLGVINDLIIDGGLTGSATGGTLSNEFSTVVATPEPFEFALVGFGLAAIAGLRRKGQ